MKIFQNLASLAIIALLAQGATAASLKCGSKVFSDGAREPATKEQVKSACGEPTSREGNQWIYKQQGKLTKIVYFDTEGRVQSITEQTVEESTGIEKP